MYRKNKKYCSAEFYYTTYPIMSSLGIRDIIHICVSSLIVYVIDFCSKQMLLVESTCQKNIYELNILAGWWNDSLASNPIWSNLNIFNWGLWQNFNILRIRIWTFQLFLKSSKYLGVNATLGNYLLENCIRSDLCVMWFTFTNLF